MRSRLIAITLILFITPTLKSLAAPSFTPLEASISDLQAAMQRGETSAVALVDWYTQRINDLTKADPD